MTTGATTKVRLVRCPRCQEVLAELPEVPLYKCGGCSTILQAKSRQPQAKRTELSDSVAKAEQEEETRSSNQGSSSPSEEGDLLDKGINLKHENQSMETGSGDHEHGDGSVDREDRLMKPQEDSSFSNCLSTSPEVNCLESEDLPKEVANSLGYEDGKCAFGRNSEASEGNILDCNGELIDGRVSSDGFGCSKEIEESTEACERMEQDCDSSRSPCTRGDQYEAQIVLQEGDKFLVELSNLSENKHQESNVPSLGEEHEKGMNNNHCPLENDGKNRDCLVDQNGDFSSAESISHVNGIEAQYAELSVEVDDDIEELCVSRNDSLDAKTKTSNGDITVASQSDLNEIISSTNLTSPDYEHLDLSTRKVIILHSGSSTSVDTMGTSPLAEIRSELTAKNMVNSPTRRYYGYAGSESSYEGTDDQTPVIISRPPRRKFKNVDHVDSVEMLNKDGLRVNSMLSSEPEMNYKRPSPSPTLQGQQHHPVKGSRWNEDKFIESERHSHVIENRMRLNAEGNVSRLPFTSRDFPVDRRTDNPSACHLNMLPSHPDLHSPEKYSYSGPDKMDLLRTVCELKDQLDRIQFPKVAPSVRFPNATEERFAPSYYHHVAQERETFADSYHPAYRHNRANEWAERCNAPRQAFSGEVSHYRHQVSCPCLSCCPQHRHRSGQLPLHSTYSINSHSMVRTGHNEYNNISSSSSPQHYSSSELSLWGREPTFDNQRRRDDEIKRLYLKEKYHTSKSHLRPIAGGAPILACYHCSEVLQLPADFLLFQKRYHLLRCNACNKILKLSLLKRKIVPYLPNSSAPPPSEADDCPVPRNTVAVSHSSSRQNVEPVSCSEDYELSSARRSSTEGEAPIIERNRKKSAGTGSSNGNTDDRKVKSVTKELQNKKKSPVEMSGGSSSNRTPKLKNASSEIRELPESTNATLHRLMGYSSVSQVFKK